jgi:hypothetical protein
MPGLIPDGINRWVAPKPLRIPQLLMFRQENRRFRILPRKSELPSRNLQPMKKYLCDLIKIDIHKLVNEVGSWETRIRGFDIALVPETFGKACNLVLFVNGQRQPMQWKLSSRPHRGFLQRGGHIPPHHDEVWFAVAGKKRYRFLYIDDDTMDIGSRDDFFPQGVQRQYRRKETKSVAGGFKDQCRDMEKELFGEKDEFAAFHHKTVLRYRFAKHS